METKKTKRLVRLTFLLVNLSCIVGIAGFFIDIFMAPHKASYKLFHFGGINVYVPFPVEPVIGIIVTAALFLVFSKLLYKSVCSKIV